ncbi:amidase family protein [Jiangella endophytica]|uniref:amidase family protein n=1 Tax=Jiangella endophytica TaxID=1623398 RepID=UPI0013005A44|nr:amidase family protein [Jiangella endophytica]
MAELLDVFAQLQRLDVPDLSIRPEGRPFRKPEPGEDDYGAVSWVCEVSGASSGALHGLRVGVKDNIAVAGIPMAPPDGGADGPVPAEDAVVVERILDAGATITAKTALGTRIRNPLDPAFSAGGSSSGSAVAVASGLVDAALGVDQGGSIRVPAAWCAIVGMKATHGLVPSYGLTYWDHTLDHIGPMTRRVADNAVMLGVLAGGDSRDPQWVRADPVATDYTAFLGDGLHGLRVGVIAESVDPDRCTSRSLDAFKQAQKVLIGLGALVTHVSVPWWRHGYAMWRASLAMGLTGMTEWFGQGQGHLGRIDESRLQPAGPDLGGRYSLPDEALAMALTAEHLRRSRLGEHYARAQNLRWELRRQVSSLFQDVDLLVAPTWPTGPDRLGVSEGSAGESEDVARSKMNWTSVFNLTGHPALSVPGFPGDDQLPTSVQFVGRHFDERAVYRAGHAFQNAVLGE